MASYPALAQAVSQLCERPPWCVTGVSGLVYDDAGLWFELGKPKNWVTRDDGVIEIGLGAIGGSLEPGESLWDCWRREMREEIGDVPEPTAAQQTLIVYEERIIYPTRTNDPLPSPVLLTVSANRHRRATLAGCETLAIVTFWGHARRRPQRGDLFGLLHLPYVALPSTLMQPQLTVGQLLEIPALVLELGGQLPEPAIIKPMWTVRSLQLALQQGALSFQPPAR
ncbi:MAG: NUDIX domain-containing protein [Anaerolineales bacterium]